MLRFHNRAFLIDYMFIITRKKFCKCLKNNTELKCLQWRIYLEKFGRACGLIFLFWANVGQIIGLRPPLGNPGSAIGLFR